MAEAIVTTVAREKLVQARAGIISLPKIVGMAFGDGGVDEDGNVLDPSATATSLANELLRKEIDGYELVTETSCRYTCTLEDADLAGYSISEIALYDADGDLVAIKNFSAKGKDSDMEMVFNIDDTF